jgi:hypothetical protein
MAALSASAARAATLYADIAAYTAFTYSLTTEDRNPGLVMGTGADPNQPYHFETELNLDTPYFIHVAVDGVDQLGGFLGSFRLSDGNGVSLLLTNTQDWGMATAAWRATKVVPQYETPVSLGFNGADPLGFREQIDPHAQVLWTSDSDCGDGCTRYFSAMITPPTQPIPEPSEALLVLAGLLALGAALGSRRSGRGAKSGLRADASTLQLSLRRSARTGIVCRAPFATHFPF